MKKVSGNPAKRAAQMKAAKLSTKAQRRFVSKSFQKACSRPVVIPHLTKVGDGVWTFNQNYDNNSALKFIERVIDPNFISKVKSGKMTTENQVDCVSSLAGLVGVGEVLSWNRFQVRDETAAPVISGRWWGMKGSEFSKTYKDIPTIFDADDVIVCDVCPEQ